MCPARPDLAQRRPAWGGGKRNFSAIFLEPLSHEDAARLTEFLLAVEDLPSSIREAMLTASRGESVLPRGDRPATHRRRAHRARRREVEGNSTTPGRSSSRTPSRACSRLASTCCPPEEKRALLSASVVGRVFWKGPVTKLLNGDAERLDELLGPLQDRELVRVAGWVQRGRRARVRLQARTHTGRRLRDAFAPRSRECACGGRRDGSNRQPASGIAEFADLLAHHYREAYEGSLADPGASPDALGRTSTQDPACVAGSVVGGAQQDAHSRKPMHCAEGALAVAVRRARALACARSARPVCALGLPR